MIEVRLFDTSHIEDASRIFAETHSEARRALALIPEQPDVSRFAEERLEKIADHAGYAAFEGGDLVGYMVELFTSENFMSRPTAFCIELFPCAAKHTHRERIYQLLYKQMSRSWIERGFHAHQFSFFATDTILSSAFFRHGFGMTHFQLFRDVTPPVGEVADVEIRYLESDEPVRVLDTEHHAYYPNAPLFWLPHDYFEDKNRDPGNGQIAAAYARPECRGRGIGKALLAEAVRWAERNSLDRLYVEGESANIYAGNFWARHFRPAEYSVRRCVDDRVEPGMFTED